MTTIELLDDIVHRLVERFHPLKIILFGSYARGQQTRDSDIDLLVVMPDGTDRRAAAIAMRRHLRDLMVPKDVIVSTPEEIARRGDMIGTVLRPALREGNMLYERT
jgi:predicted nucleotidyltransferase